MDKRVLIHDRIGVQGQEVPVQEDTFVDIPEEYLESLGPLKLYIDELNNARLELGRLMQITTHLVNVCNRAEQNAANAKRDIINGMGLGEGNWAIDLESNKIGKVVPPETKVPLVVGA